ncbi:MAG: helix-hairpin-helix domain-containing protein [Pirellulaceae bacterium]|nr:helix-hairpin-helix domain-containing protein [Pirellulaceae bacterium]MDG2105499.1 helix-hairpin-helix domain-containing protein [Pirellulaceae bacterium]
MPDQNRPPLDNTELAQNLQRAAELLLEQGANRFRAAAYEKAAQSIRKSTVPLWRIYEAGGIFGLENIDGVGRTISRALQQLICGERWPLLQRLQGGDSAETAFASVPSIGPKLAKRIHDELHVESLAELQVAAWDGRLIALEGFGEKRLRAVKESLLARGRTSEISMRSDGGACTDSVDLTSEIPVSELLDIDDEYAFKSIQRKIIHIAPKKNNPHNRAWLPILHTARENRHYTALFSNSDHAHAMGTTKDWVIIYLEDHNHRGQHGRWTVITSRFGKLRGKRIVRGREKACEIYYRERAF